MIILGFTLCAHNLDKYAIKAHIKLEKKNGMLLWYHIDLSCLITGSQPHPASAQPFHEDSIST